MAQNPFSGGAVNAGSYNATPGAGSGPLTSLFQPIQPGQAPIVDTGLWLQGQQAAANDRANASQALGATQGQFQNFVNRGPSQAGAYGRDQNSALSLAGQSALGNSQDIALLQSAAMGNQPSAAQLQQQAGEQQALAQAQAQANSTRGNFGLAAAQKGAQAQAATGAENAASQGAILRAQEMAQARGAYSGALQGAQANYGQLAQGARGQDVAFGQGVNQYQQGQAANELGLYGQQAGYAGQALGYDQTAAGQAAQLASQQAQLEGQQNQTAVQAQSQTQQTGGNLLSGIVSGAGSLLGGVFSDENIKTDIGPADDGSSSGGAKFGKAIASGMQSFGSGYNRSNANARPPSMPGTQAPQQAGPTQSAAPAPQTQQDLTRSEAPLRTQAPEVPTPQPGQRLHDPSQHSSTNDDSSYWAAVMNGFQPNNMAVSMPGPVSDERVKHPVGHPQGHAMPGPVSDEQAKKDVYQQGVQDGRMTPEAYVGDYLRSGKISPDDVAELLRKADTRRAQPAMEGQSDEHIQLPRGQTRSGISQAAHDQRVANASPIMQQMDHFTPTQFRYKDARLAPNPEAGNMPHVGVIAQDVEQGPAGASLVRHDPRTGLRSLDTNAMVGALAAGSGALKKRTDDHADRLQALESAVYGRGP